MKTIAAFLVLIFGAAGSASPVLASGGEEMQCKPADIKRGDETLKRAESAERAGRMKEAYDIVRGDKGFGCAPNAYPRSEGILSRTGKKLGEEAEKAGRFDEAFGYFDALQQRTDVRDYSNTDRVMLKHAKAKPEDLAVVSKAVGHFEKRGNQASLKETRALAKAAGEKALEKETKAFAAAGRDSRAELNDARRWFDLAAGPPRAQERAVQRADALLAEGTPSSVELAFEYYQFAHSEEKLKNARTRAQKLGDEAARKGDQGLAARFYALSGDKTKAAAVEKQKEKTETKRQQQFKKDQQSLEKELGL